MSDDIVKRSTENKALKINSPMRTTWKNQNISEETKQIEDDKCTAKNGTNSFFNNVNQLTNGLSKLLR